MKNTVKILFLVSVIVYSYLFFRQGGGVNYLIFSTLLILFLRIIYPASVKLILWKIMAGASIISAINFVWNHSDVALIANLISILVLSGLSIVGEGSFLISGIQSGYSIILSPFKKLIKYYNTSDNHGTKSNFKFLVYIIPIFITIIFFLLYSKGNAVFASFLSQISFDFISWQWVFFTLGGFLLLFGVFFPSISLDLINFFEKQPDTILRKKSIDKSFKPLGLKTEFQIGKLLLILLNLLLVLVNILDVVYMYFLKMPEGTNPSVVVHEGIQTLIFSIILAIIIILYLFRANLNFFRENKILKILGYIWIVQNMIMILNISFKNQFYILEQGLTFKRIGVFFYLLLTLIGLITTYYKIYAVKSNWYLVKINSFLFFIVLLISSFFNWTNLVTNYNLTHTRNTEIDYDYLIYLSDSNIPQLQSLLNDNKISPDKKNNIKIKSDQFYDNYLSKGWQSWNYDDYKINIFLKEYKNKPNH